MTKNERPLKVGDSVMCFWRVRNNPCTQGAIGTVVRFGADIALVRFGVGFPGHDGEDPMVFGNHWYCPIDTLLLLN